MKNKEIFRDGKGRFIKGILKPFSNKGKHWKLSEETKEKMSESHKGWKNPNYGKTFTEEHRLKLSKAHKGRRLTEEHKNRTKINSPKILLGKHNSPQTEFKKGHKHSEETKRKISESHKKIINWNYVDGRSKRLSPARYGDDWDKIRYLIYLKDRFTCQHCGIQGKRLDVHHKIPFLISFDNSLNNLITLCRPCHMKEERRIIQELKSIKVGRIEV